MNFTLYIRLRIVVRRFTGKPVHTVQLLLAERMYKLRDVAQNIEFYGPPHPEDPQGKLICFTYR